MPRKSMSSPLRHKSGQSSLCFFTFRGCEPAPTTEALDCPKGSLAELGLSGPGPVFEDLEGQHWHPAALNAQTVQFADFVALASGLAPRLALFVLDGKLSASPASSTSSLRAAVAVCSGDGPSASALEKRTVYASTSPRIAPSYLDVWSLRKAPSHRSDGDWLDR